ncbi:MAG: S41 family peptidase [Gemmatimonadaceae bacterium]|nr:S41 family peptidase [Gemmatimonadaceae bacterium]
MTRLRRAAALTLVLVPLATGAFVLQPRPTRQGAQLLDQVLTLVSLRFVDTVDANALYEKSARGLVRELGDPYSELLTPKDLEAFTRTTAGRYAGVGMLLTPPIAGFVTVDQVFPNSPAESRGVQPGDRIVEVDTFRVSGWPVERVQEKLLGEAGTPVSITFRRQGVATPLRLQFKRAQIIVPAVAYHVMLDKQTGYIPLARFGEHTTQDVAAAVTALQQQGAKGLVIDLRGNPGGLVEEAFGMANLFLPRGKELLTVRERTGDQHMVADRDPLAPTIPLVVLVDGASASSAEIVAGALQDYDRAVVLGTTSFGKGLVQSVYSMDGGYALKMTTGRWFTPSGRSIQKPRQFDEAGRWVEVESDSLETSAVRAKRPTYKSASGRTLYGGGAITPDVIVPADTITSAELALRRALAPHYAKFFDHINVIAEEQKGKVAESFTVTAALRDDLYGRLVADSVRIDRAVYDAGAADVDRALASRIAKVSFGDGVARRHSMPDDNQLLRAVALLRSATTQSQLIASLPKLSPR